MTEAPVATFFAFDRPIIYTQCTSVCMALKPTNFCRFLIGKHSYAGDVVVDLCACTGSMALAAADMERRWVYVESNQVNYELRALILGSSHEYAASHRHSTDSGVWPMKKNFNLAKIV